MKIAVISDVHGNLHALDAVIADAKKAEAEKYVFLGDYYIDMPFQNEVVEAMKSLPAVFVRGNKEDYLRGLSPDRSTWTDDQNASLYWNYEHLTEQNRSFLINLPEEAVFCADGCYFRAFHLPEYVFGGTNVLQLSSRNFYRRMKERPFTQQEYLAHVNTLLTGDAALCARLDGLPDGCYLFGHTHNQWHWRGRGKLLLNPGSCGMSLNFDTSAAYSILEYANGTYYVDERRVRYDTEAAVKSLEQSALYGVSPLWSSIVTKHLRLAEDHVQFLVDKGLELAAARGEHGDVFSNYVWNEACRYYAENFQKGENK